MSILTRSQILEATDNVAVSVEVPEWGGSVMVRALTGKERDIFEQSMIEMQGKQVTMKLANARARLVAMATVDEEGKSLFTLSDVEALGKKNAMVLDRLSSKIQEMSGLSGKDLTELTANFTIGPSAASTSD